GNDDQVRLLQAAGHLVELFVVGLQAGGALAALQESVHRTKTLLNDLLHAHKAAADALLRKLEDGGFGVIQDVFGGIALVGSARNGRIGRVNQAAQQSLVAHDADVVLNAGPVGDAVEQAGDVADVADGLQFLGAVELFHQGDQVDRPRRVHQRHHAGVDAAVGVEREVLRSQVFGGFVVG